MVGVKKMKDKEREKKMTEGWRDKKIKNGEKIWKNHKRCKKINISKKNNRKGAK